MEHGESAPKDAEGDSLSVAAPIAAAHPRWVVGVQPMGVCSHSGCAAGAVLVADSEATTPTNVQCQLVMLMRAPGSPALTILGVASVPYTLTACRQGQPSAASERWHSTWGSSHTLTLALTRLTARQ